MTERLHSRESPLISVPSAFWEKANVIRMWVVVTAHRGRSDVVAIVHAIISMIAVKAMMTFA